MAMAWEWYQREPEGAGVKLEALAAVRRDEGGVFFFDAVDVGGDGEAVPVDELRGVGVVDDVDGDGLAFLHAEDGAGGGAVVADGGEDAVGGEFDGDGGDAEGDVAGAAAGGAAGCSGGHVGARAA